VGAYVVSSSKSMPKSFNHVVGDTASIQCIAWGLPPPNITWVRVHDGVETLLHNKNGLSIGDKIDGTDVKGSLMITELAYEDYADYYCVAKNEHGQYNQSTKLRVKGESVVFVIEHRSLRVGI